MSVVLGVVSANWTILLCSASCPGSVRGLVPVWCPIKPPAAVEPASLTTHPDPLCQAPVTTTFVKLLTALQLPSPFVLLSPTRWHPRMVRTQSSAWPLARACTDTFWPHGCLFLDPYYASPTSQRRSTPETQPSLSPPRTIRSLPQRRSKRPRLNITPPPPPPGESCSPTDASGGGRSPVTPPARSFAYHSPSSKAAIAAITHSVAALNIRPESRSPMNPAEAQFEAQLDPQDAYPFRAPQLSTGQQCSDEDRREEGNQDNGQDRPEDEQEDDVDEADQDFSAYPFLSPNEESRPAPNEHSNANRKKRKVPSPAVVPHAPSPLQYGLDYALKSAKSTSGYLLPPALGHAGPAFGQLLRAAQLEDGGGEYDDLEDEEEDTSSVTPPVDFRDPVAMAKGDSSR